MALIFLFLAFLSALFGGYVFLDGYFSADTAATAWSSALTGLAFAAIPYLIGKSLSEMVAIRQRHLLLEQQAQNQQLLLQLLQPAPPPAPQPTVEPTSL